MSRNQAWKETSAEKAPHSLVNVRSCKCCIESISISVRWECITLCTLDGNDWKRGKAIRDGVQVFPGWKYLASKAVSATVRFSLKTGVWMVLSSFTFFPRGTYCSIDSSTNWTSGLKIWGIWNKHNRILA